MTTAESQLGANELIGCVAAAYLHDVLSDVETSGGTARILLDGLSISQTVAIAHAVLSDAYLSRHMHVRLPATLFADSGLPEEVLTVRNATYYRSANCDRSAYLITNATPPWDETEDMSLHELTPLGVAQLIERMSVWVREAGRGLGLTDEAGIWWERALSGLIQLSITSLDRFTEYVLAVRHAIEVEGSCQTTSGTHPLATLRTHPPLLL